MNRLIRRLGDASARRPKRTVAAWTLLSALDLERARVVT